MVTSMKITPGIAREFLSHNTRNIRPMNKSAIKQYAESMRAGTWQANGETIKFYEDGTLFDGQHRLQAIIESGTTQEMLVVTGVPNDVSVTDIGRTRSAKVIADNMCGHSISSNAISAAKIIVDGLEGANRSTTPKEMIARYAVDHTDLLREADSLASTGKNSSIHLTRRAYVIALFYCYLRTAENVSEISEKIRKFVMCINTGFYENERDQSAIVLRNYLIDQTSKTNSSWVACASVVDQAFNDFGVRKRFKRYVPNGDVIGKVNTVRLMDGIIK